MSPLLAEDAEFSHSIDESGAAYSEPHSGTLWTTDNPIGLPQRFQNIFTFDILERGSSRKSRATSGAGIDRART
jgi:hypothetical protein